MVSRISNTKLRFSWYNCENLNFLLEIRETVSWAAQISWNFEHENMFEMIQNSCTKDNYKMK